MDALVAGIVVIALLSVVRILLKMAAVLPVSRLTFKRDSTYVSFLMATSLTFGLVFLQFGIEQGLIDRTQFSILVGVILIGALAPNMIAQRWFDPWKASR